MEAKVFYTLETKARKYLGHSTYYSNLAYCPDAFERELIPKPTFPAEAWFSLTGVTPRHVEVYNYYARALYCKCAIEGRFAGKRVAEIGSGKGQGASDLFDLFKLKKMVGLDLTPEHTLTASEQFGREGVEYGTADACDIDPKWFNKFDAVVNIESSHAYPDFPGFISSVNKMLVAGGTFVLADFRPKGMEQKVIDTIEANGFTMTKKQDISFNVAAGAHQWGMPTRFVFLLTVVFYLMYIPYRLSSNFKRVVVHANHESSTDVHTFWGLFTFFRGYIGGQHPIWHYLRKQHGTYFVVVAQKK